MTSDKKAEHSPLVSIGLPVFNGENFLAQALDAILAQTFTDFELIISDNASTDTTADICQAYAAKDSRIRYSRSDVNRGASWNFNNVFRLSRGKYFAWAAHDDLHHPSYFEKCVAVLERSPSVVLCFARTTFVDENNKELREYKYPIDVQNVSKRRLFLHFASSGHIVHEIFGVIRSDVLRKTPLIGGYVGSDLILLGRLALLGQFHQVSECLFQHREHTGRSTLSTGGVEGFTQWYDSSRSGKFVMPHWRRLFENAKSVLTHPMKISEKMACLLDLCRGVNWNREAFAEDLFRVMKAAIKGS